VIKEPKRLIEGQGPLAESLAATQLRLPSEARLAALAARLASSGVVLAEPAPSPLASEPPRPVLASKTPLELSLKLVISSVALGVLAIAGALAYRHASRANHSVSPSQIRPENAMATIQTPQAPPARAITGAGGAAPAAPVRSSVAAAIENRASSVAPPRFVDEASENAPLARAEKLVSDKAPPVLRELPAGSEPRAPTHASEPVAKRAPLNAPARNDGSASQAQVPSLPANTVIDSEVEMLKKARNALGSDSLEAFALSERCRAQYPNGAFTQEREFIAISALVRLGRRDEARSRASLFRTHYRNSAYLPQLTRMLGEE
jgi:hypothetical protein